MKTLKAALLAALCAIFMMSCNQEKANNTTDGGSKEDETPVSKIENISGQAEIPILAWYSIPEAYLTLDNFKDLKKAGFTISFSHLYNLEAAKKALDLGEQSGVKIMFMCGDVLNSDTENVVNQVKDHPALYGYFLRDEPMNADLPALGEWADRVRAADPNHPIYLNLNPNYVNTEVLGSSYEEHVRKFIEIVNPPLVSFDHYPIVGYNVRENWWENLEIISRESAAAGLPFWAFTLSTAHDPYPIATMESMRLQLYTDLAYGAQCLQYFTYWCPGTETWNFHEAPIDQEGNKTAVYDLVKAMNKEIQNRAAVFAGCKVLQVRHTGNEIPQGTTALTECTAPLKSLDTKGKGAMVSLIENGDYQYVVLVNRSHLEEFDYTISFTKDVAQIYNTGEVINIPGRNATRHLDKGDCAIFRCKK